MKRGTFTNSSESIIRLLLIAPNLFQVSFRNVYGYLKTVLLDRCKKVGAQYRHFEKSYVISSDKIKELIKEFGEVLQMKNGDSQIKFKIEDYPKANIHMIIKQNTSFVDQDKIKNQNRMIYLDKYSMSRYFYVKKKIENFINKIQKQPSLNEPKNILIMISESNKKLWTSVVLNKKNSTHFSQLSLNKQQTQLVQLTYSELQNKKSNSSQNSKQVNSTHQLHKIYLITYDNLKFIQNSWFIRQMKSIGIFLTDDAQFLIGSQSQISTLQNKKKNFEVYRYLAQNYNVESQMIVFFSKLPEPVDLIKLLVLMKPSNFSGIKMSSILKNSFQESKLTSEQRKLYEQYIGWFKKRYRCENKCFKQIFFLLKNTIVNDLDEKIFKITPNIIPSLQISSKFSYNHKITLLESQSQIMQKFKAMDKKYKRLCPSINLKQILENFHDKQKSQQNKFQITTKLQDHLVTKTSKNYLIQAKQLMLNSKIDMVSRKLFFTINAQKQRIVIVVQDERLQKKLKKYFKETQIQYIDYTLTKQNNQNQNKILQIFKSKINSLTFNQFDLYPQIQVCIINIYRLHKQYIALAKEKKQKIQNGYENQLQCQNYYQQQNDILIPKITTAESIHFIDSYWNQFIFQKELLLNEIFNFQLSFIEETKIQNKCYFKQIFKKPQIIQNYFIFDGSNEKMMLENYLKRKQQLQSFKIQSIQQTGKILQTFINGLISNEKCKFQNLKCQVIDYLDIDDQYDKVQQQAKRLKNCINPLCLEQKVFLPKYTKPDSKSFKQMIQQKLSFKNIDEILDQSDNDISSKQQNINILSQFIKQNSTCQQNQNCQVTVDMNNRYIVGNQQQLIDYLIPQIQVETVKLQSNQQYNLSYSFKSNFLPNIKQQDLFDQLLAPKLNNYDNCGNYDQFSSQLTKKSYQTQDIQTQSEFQQDKIPTKWKIQSVKQSKQTQSKQKQIFQNFGYLAYHKKQQIPNQQNDISIDKYEIEAPLKNKQISQNKSLLKKKKLISSNKNQSKVDSSIEIITPNEVIDVESINPIKLNKNLRLGKPKNLRQKIKQNTNKIPFYQLPKEKRMCNKKLYEEAISKSKQLWQKKLRKQKELLILAPKKLSLALISKKGWRQKLTQQEKEVLLQKGIKI